MEKEADPRRGNGMEWMTNALLWIDVAMAIDKREIWGGFLSTQLMGIIHSLSLPGMWSFLSRVRTLKNGNKYSALDFLTTYLPSIYLTARLVTDRVSIFWLCKL